MGSAGVKAMAVVTGEVDAYVHGGGQYEWDSAAPVAVAAACGLHTSRLDGSPLTYNNSRPVAAGPAGVQGRAGTGPGGCDCPDWRRTMTRYVMSQLRALEAESIHIIREVAAEMQRPCLLFSGGKDSVVMSVLARKAFAPSRIPFPFMHVDTGLNFPEVIAFRDWLARPAGGPAGGGIGPGGDRARAGEGGAQRLPQPDPDPGAAGRRGDPPVRRALRGARRDEEKARAKERVFSFRDDFGQWDPKNQRPELWSLYNGRVNSGESIRVFPMSNWTELDTWAYIEAEDIPLPNLYYAQERDVVARDGMLYAVNEFVVPKDGEEVIRRRVRYRTMGDANLTAAVASDAETNEAIVAEIAAARLTERGATRGDDRVSEAAMEDRKKEGYF